MESLLPRPCIRSNHMGHDQKFQSWKCEEQPKPTPGITRGFRLVFSWTAAISLCRTQGIMDVAFMPSLYLTFHPSPPSFYYNTSLSLLLIYSHNIFGGRRHHKEYPTISSSEECLTSKGHLLKASKRPDGYLHSLEVPLGSLPC